jgi:DNA-binding PadR family transcriptional regulator
VEFARVRGGDGAPPGPPFRPGQPTIRDRRYHVLRYTVMRSSDPSLLIMASLAEGAKHGYAITRDVHEIAGVTLGPGTLYGAIARLEERGLIEPLEADDRRRPYRLTRSGAAVLREQLTAQERVASVGLRRLSAAEVRA